MKSRSASGSLVTFCVAAFGLLVTANQAHAKEKAVTFGITDVPRWVKPISVEPPDESVADSGGISYLLVNRQRILEPTAYYRHEIRKITSETGVQNGAAITVSFDPSFEKLAFHFIRVVRNSVAANRLDRTKITLLRRERDLELFLYDGAYTAQYELEDVRVGDVIEFAYTIEGANPVRKGKFSDISTTQWSYPVARSVLRFVYPTRRAPEFFTKSRDLNPKVTNQNGITEWLLDESDIPGRQVKNDTPAEYEPRGSMQITEYRSWKEVVDWAVPLFRTDAVVSADLKAEVDRLKAIPDPEQRTLAALRFVQDEIRYLGIESGVGSHQPSLPSEVLRRRFGDCKDKALLLTTLLRHSAIEASPALVSTTFRSTVGNWLPAPDVFDHVIVQVRLTTGNHWLDATRSNQRGPLSQIYVGELGQALVLRPGTEGFAAFGPPPESFPRKRVVERYKIPAPPDGVAELEVSSEFRGLAADRIRSSFQQNRGETIQKDYLQYYTRRFPAIEVRQPLVFQESAVENACTITEYYRIPKVWELKDEKKRYQVLLNPAELDSEMGSVGPSQRDDPLALNHPVDITQEIHAEMFEDWPIDFQPVETKNAFFDYRENGKATGRDIHLTYQYRTLADRVSVADLPAYNAALWKIKDTLGYTISYTTPDQLEALRREGRFNWLMAVVLACVLALAVLASVWYFRVSKLPEILPPPLPDSASLEGLGGWLVLVGIGLGLSPIQFIWGAVDYFPVIFNLETWRGLTEPGDTSYHPLWAPGLLFGLFYNTLCAIFSLLVLALFVKKRAAWKYCYVLFLLILVGGVTADFLFTKNIPAAAADILPASSKEIVRAVVAACIWIPYVFRSKRVKATFRY